MTVATRAFGLAVAAFTAFAVVRGDRRIVAYLAVLAVSAAVVAIAHRRTPLQRRHALALAACGVLHLAGGLIPGDPVFYETWLVPHVLKYDQAVHFTITAVLTTVLLHRGSGTATRAVALALAAGLGNEVFELASSLRFADAYIGDVTNAAWDLVFNGFGALSAVALARGVRWPLQLRAAEIAD